MVSTHIDWVHIEAPDELEQLRRMMGQQHISSKRTQRNYSVGIMSYHSLKDRADILAPVSK